MAKSKRKLSKLCNEKSEKIVDLQRTIHHLSIVNQDITDKYLKARLEKEALFSQAVFFGIVIGVLITILILPLLK